ncbi:ER membrane protein complex subunit 7 [Nomascus leucogenys]|uniref:ER membrane protein complex subunit 7 n=1 Tax=Nomascus leucogenys TaxID=61853 RepID=UPI00122D56AA|nr:ER membrane protein complex subunit 7 [Nomascus leucogenys]
MTTSSRQRRRWRPGDWEGFRGCLSECRAAVMAAALWGFFPILLLLLSGNVQSSEVPGAAAEGSGGTGVGIGDRFKIEGRAIVPGVKPQDWISAARVLVDGEEHVGFLKTDGSFVVHDIPSGSYVVEVVSPAYRFDPVRVDITSKGKMRARYVNYIKTSEVVRLPYPLQMKSSGPPSYFIKRESWGWTDFLMNPMVMMMVLPLLIFVLLPKVVNTSDPDMRREMEQSMNMLNSNHELPDVSEFMTRLFSSKSSGKSSSGSSKTGKSGAGKRR